MSQERSTTSSCAGRRRTCQLMRANLANHTRKAITTTTMTTKPTLISAQTKALFYFHQLSIILLVSANISVLLAQAADTANPQAPVYYASNLGASHVHQTENIEGAHDAAIQTVATNRQAPGQQQQQQQQVVSQKLPTNGRQFGDTISDISIECNSHNIVVTLQTNSGFNGMIYPKGLSKNSTCMMEYHQLSSNITYYLPLKSCNTMSTDVEDGVEYFNTVMVQPHRRLVTNQGRGYHIRCRYQTKERTITNQDQQLSVNLTQSTPSVMGSASMPTCTMRIYGANDLSHEVSAENVRIGDELHLIISLDDQDVYGMLVTNCLVRDGMNWGEQPLIDDHGCPVDEEIMPEFTYAANLTRASVTFQAHKFPYTSSVYYQCNVRLCFRDTGGCSHVPPNCSPGNHQNQHRPALIGNMIGDHYKSATGSGGGGSISGSNEIPAAGGSVSLSSSSSSSHKQRSSARTRRWVDGGELDAVALPGEQPVVSSGQVLHSRRDLSIEVSSGLHVDESELEPSADSASSSAYRDRDPLMMASTNDDPDVVRGETVTDQPSEKSARDQRQQSERDFCMSLRKFAIIVSLISLLLMTAIIIMIAWLIQRRNRQKLEEQMHSQYDQHPYHANRGYCRE